jgi:hypothetical protein
MRGWRTWLLAAFVIWALLQQRVQASVFSPIILTRAINDFQQWTACPFHTTGSHSCPFYSRSSYLFEAISFCSSFRSKGFISQITGWISVKFGTGNWRLEVIWSFNFGPYRLYMPVARTVYMKLPNRNWIYCPRNSLNKKLIRTEWNET